MGLMGDPEYCRRALKKEEMYIKNGYRTGIDIIYTRESSGYTISTKVIDQIIKEFFLWLWERKWDRGSGQVAQKELR